MDSETAREQNIASTGGNITSLIQDTLLLTQFLDDRRRQSRLEPEKRLMLAILEDAVCCFQDHHAVRRGKRKQIFDNVERWFFDESHDWVFSFENICSVLELSAEYIRAGLVRWRKKQLSKHRDLPSWSVKKTPELRLAG